MPKLTPELRQEYLDLFDSCETRPERVAIVGQIAAKAIQNRQRYEELEALTDVPWYIIAAIHNLEASQDFHGHLHNGDPLTARTFHVPKNRPPGNPPFTFQESGVDAMRFDRMDQNEDWTLPGALYRLEGFNGFGSRAHGINTPYLWSFSNHYTKGKFVSDDVFNANAVSDQCGAVPMLRK